MAYVCPSCNDHAPGLNRRNLPFKLDVERFKERATTLLGACPRGSALLDDPEIGSLSMVTQNSLENKCPFCTANMLKVLQIDREHCVGD